MNKITIIFVLALMNSRANAQTDIKALPANEQQRLHANYERWQSLPPEQKVALQSDFERWKQMSETEKRRIAENFSKFQALDTKKQEKLRQKITNLSAREKSERRLKHSSGEKKTRENRHHRG